MLFRPLLRVCSTVVLITLLIPPVFAQSTLRASGAPVHLIGGEAEAFIQPEWSPDGSRLALTRPGYDGLWTVQPDGEGLQEITDETGVGFGFAWSPDGKALLARVTQVEGAQRRHAVKVFDLVSGEAEELTDYRARMPALPQWSADGSAVVLSAGDGLEVLTRSAPENASARSVSLSDPVFLTSGTTLEAVRDGNDGLRAEPLLDGRRVLNAVSSPDRSRVAFEVMGGNLHVMNADGSRLTDLGPGHRPSWSPDGRWIAFMRTEDDGHRFTAADLFAVRADGSGELVALTQTPSRLEMNPSWSPDGRTIAFDELSEGAVYLLPLAQ